MLAWRETLNGYPGDLCGLQRSPALRLSVERKAPFLQKVALVPAGHAGLQTPLPCYGLSARPVATHVSLNTTKALS